MNSPMYLFLAAAVWIAPHAPLPVSIPVSLACAMAAFWLILRKDK